MKSSERSASDDGVGRMSSWSRVGSGGDVGGEAGTFRLTMWFSTALPSVRRFVSTTMGIERARPRGWLIEGELRGHGVVRAVTAMILVERQIGIDEAGDVRIGRRDGDGGRDDAHRLRDWRAVWCRGSMLGDRIPGGTANDGATGGLAGGLVSFGTSTTTSRWRQAVQRAGRGVVDVRSACSVTRTRILPPPPGKRAMKRKLASLAVDLARPDGTLSSKLTAGQRDHVARRRAVGPRT